MTHDVIAAPLYGTPRQGRTLWLACLVLFLSACAASPPAPTEQLAVSAAAIEQAVSAGAAELAPAELGAARDKLARARAAMTTKDHDLARTLAEQAQADAQLAVTRARSAKAEKAAAALADDRRVLRDEMQRNAK